MGGDMANVRNSDLKVPPLKIVLSAANSGSSDRSSSTSPSSESESLDSNVTIISDNQHDRPSASKSEPKDETVQSKQERSSRNVSRVAASERNSSNNTALSSKRSYDNNGSIEDKLNGGDSVAGRELTSSSTQRITRSSQRAAQQNKAENITETTSDETTAPELQDKTIESARKVKRRKGEQPPDTEQDMNQQVPAPPPPPVMSKICPADYELPLQNSFELYRDIRKRPYKKLSKLSSIQPKMPHGFKDYLLNSGPYLLDDNRIGVGIKGGSSVDCKEALNPRTNRMPNRVPPKLKYTSNQHKFPASSSQQPLNHDYGLPKLLEAPRNLKYGSPLYELFLDQERSRQKMRLQHLTERERSIISSEQEILRTYNKAAIVDIKQDLILSACTYLYLQERYHYFDEKNDSIDCVNPKDLISNQNNSEATTDDVDRPLPSDNTMTQDSEASKLPANLTSEVVESKERGDTSRQANCESENQTEGVQDNKPAHKRRKRASECHSEEDADARNDGPSDKHGNYKSINDISLNDPSGSDQDRLVKKELVPEPQANEESKSATVNTSTSKTTPVELSEADQLIMNKSAFLDNLQAIDDKWARIKRDMLIRHKNEADSLFAVQSLDWEWKAKEIGACDVRVALKIEPEFVPRVEVSAQDY